MRGFQMSNFRSLGRWALMIFVGFVVAACASTNRPYYEDTYSQQFGSLKDSAPAPAAYRHTSRRKVGRTVKRKARRSTSTKRARHHRSTRLSQQRRPAARRAPSPTARPATSDYAGPKPTARPAPTSRPTQRTVTPARPAAKPRPDASQKPSKVAKFSAPAQTPLQAPTRQPVAPKPQTVPAASSVSATSAAPAAPPTTTLNARTPAPTNSATCPGGNAACETKLATLLADPARAWISQPATAADYVSGARLVAFDRLRDDLTCKELLRGIEESQTAVLALGTAISDDRELGRPTARLQKTETVAKSVRDRLVSARKDRC